MMKKSGWLMLKKLALSISTRGKVVTKMVRIQIHQRFGRLKVLKKLESIEKKAKNIQCISVYATVVI